MSSQIWDTANLAFFARQFLMCSSDNITFQTIPANYNDSIKGLSYVSIYVDEWITMINEKLNPYDQACHGEQREHTHALDYQRGSTPPQAP